MKKILLLFTVISLSVTCIHAQVKIGVADAQKILLNSSKGKQVQAELEAIRKQKETELNTLTENVKRMEKDLQAKAASMSEQTLQERTRELNTLKTELARRSEDAQRELSTETNKKLQEMEKSIMPVINKYGKENGFTVIYDISQAGIMYYDSTIDVSDAIIAELNAQ